MTIANQSLPCQGRLTLDPGANINPFGGTSSDLTGLSTVYFQPCGGNLVPFFLNEYAEFRTVGIPNQGISILLIDSSQTGTLTNGSNIVTGLTSTQQLVASMKVSGTGIAANSVISSVDSLTQVTLNNNCTSTTSSALTFKIPANTNVDIYAWLVNGDVILQFGDLWTNDTTRAVGVSSVLGIYCNNGALHGSQYTLVPSSRAAFLGTIRTTSTDGQTEDSKLRRFVSNIYNLAPKRLLVTDATSSWNYTTATWRQVRATSTNRVECVCADPAGQKHGISLRALHILFNSLGGLLCSTGVGIDSTTTNSAECNGGSGPGVNQVGLCNAFYEGSIATGYHALNWLEISAASGTTTWIGASAALAGVQSGMSGTILC